jgi:flap endonuclease-1
MNDNSIGTVEDIDKLARRQVRPTRVHNEECRRLLKLMGIPVIVVSHDAYRLLVSLEAKVWPASSIGSRRGRSSMRRTRERRQGQSFRSCRYAHRLIRSSSAQVYGAGSEDMDTLTFNAPVLLRHLTFSEAKKAPISEINLKQVLEELEMDMERVCFVSPGTS